MSEPTVESLKELTAAQAIQKALNDFDRLLIELTAAQAIQK